ncbi:MAG TPA: ATP-binding protein [Blastocatellia bacterium]|nr:ATP-binding protein [Blastocatellia bacterium]
MNLPAATRNPFRNAVAADPWQSPEADVITIHDQAFRRCCRALDDVRLQGRTSSVLIYGEAGSGKTHLLSRLRAHIVRPDATDQAIFIAVTLQTSPQMIWRYLRRRLVDDLLRRPNEGVSQFERVLLHRLAESHPRETDVTALLQRLRNEARHHNNVVSELSELFDHVEAQSNVSFDLSLRSVIGHLLLRRHVSEARAWLRGESLHENALNRMEIGIIDSEDSAEDQARDILLSLCSLAGQQIPLIFCFDQVEAMQINPQDHDGLFAFGQVVMSLHDSTRNLLLISCIQAAFFDTLHLAISKAAWDRLTSGGQEVLRPLDRSEAEQLVKARLDAGPELAQLRAAQSNPLWPLTAADVTAALDAAGRCTPRRLLGVCAERFEAICGSDLQMPPPPSVDEFIAELWRSQIEQSLAESSPEETDQIVTHGLPLLCELAGLRCRPRDNKALRDVSLLADGQDGPVSISLCNQENMTSLAGRLRRLNASPPERLVLLRDDRLPLGRHATMTRQYSEQLLTKGAHWVKPSAEALAALDALRILLSEAKSGNLEQHGETLPAATVEEWLKKNLPLSLKDLLDDLLPQKSRPETGDFPLCEDIAELLHRHYLVKLEDAACMLKAEAAAIEECARQHADRFGLLDGPPAVLFQLTTETAEVQEVI